MLLIVYLSLFCLSRVSLSQKEERKKHEKLRSYSLESNKQVIFIFGFHHLDFAYNVSEIKMMFVYNDTLHMRMASNWKILWEQIWFKFPKTKTQKLSFRWTNFRQKEPNPQKTLGDNRQQMF